MKKQQPTIRAICNRSCQRLKWFLSASSILLSTGIVVLLETAAH